jgi:cysteine desulfuration protein SufE
MTAFDAIAADLQFLDDWDERYKYLIDLGRGLPPFPESLRSDARKVRGCASQVWLEAAWGPDGRLRLSGDSDAHIVKGLVALLIALYADKTREEALALDARAALAPLELDGHLTPQRSNGLAAMIRRIRDIAALRPDAG